MSTTFDQMAMQGGGMTAPPPDPTAPDPEKGDQDIDLHAYGLAAKAGDSQAMAELHQSITARQQRMSQRAQQADLSSTPIQTKLAGFGQGILKAGDSVNSALNNTYGKLLGTKIPVSTDPETDKALLENPEGSKGALLGSLAATAPIGAAGGALGSAITGGKLAASTLPAALARYGARTAIGAGENAAANELQGDDPTKGAEVGGALTAATGLGGKLVKGVVGKTDAAQRLIDQSRSLGGDTPFFPISQAGTGPAKFIYQKALPYTLGAEQQMRRQSNQAASDISNTLASTHGVPQVDSTGALVQPSPVGKTGQETAENIRNQFDQAYDATVKPYSFSKPANFRQDVIDNLSNTGVNELPDSHKAALANHLDAVYDQFADNQGNITGANLLRAKAAARQTLPNVNSDTGIPIGDKGSTEQGIGTFDDIVQDAIDQHKQMASPKSGLSASQQASAAETVRDLENYQRLSPNYGGANAFAESAEQNVANRGTPRFGDLAKRYPDGSLQQGIAQDAHAVLENESSGGVSPAGRHFLHTAGEATKGLAGPAGLVAIGHPGAAIGLLGAGNLAATKTFQKGLYGDLASQQAIASALRNNPKTAHMASFLGRQDASGQ
jgi:hypothetical protein